MIFQILAQKKKTIYFQEQWQNQNEINTLFTIMPSKSNITFLLLISDNIFYKINDKYYTNILLKIKENGKRENIIFFLLKLI